MEYYCLTIDKRYSEAPVIKNWTGKIQREYITEEKSYLLQQRELLEIVENKNVFFTDIVVFPFFLVSDMCKNVISLYEPKTKFKQIVLMEMKTSKYQVYHLPILKKIHGMETVRKVGKISDNKLFREIRGYINSNKVERYISNVAKACGYKGTFATRAEALTWARENARSMIMSLGGKSALTVTVRTFVIELSVSGCLSDFVSGIFLKEDEDTENSLKIVQKYIEQYGY